MADKKDDALPTPKKPVGQAGLILTSTFVNENKKEDMKMPKRLCVFDEMSKDPAVKAPLDRSSLPVFKALMFGKWVSSGTRRSEGIAEFFNYVMHTMPDQYWSEFCANAVADTKYGFSLQEIVPTYAKSGPYQGSVVFKEFSPRSQKSVYAWVWDDSFNKVIGFVQKPKVKRWQSLNEEFGSYLGWTNDLSLLTSQYHDYKYPIISMKDTVHFKYNSTNNNPEGESPLEACYAPWKEKIVIGKYQVIGISRDFGGVPIVRLPTELIQRANDPEGRYPEDKRIYDEYKRQLANMHAGEQAYMILSSQINPDSTNLYDYDFKLQGVEGGGKQFDISEIIKSKNTDIANAFLAGHLLLGQQGNTSSYNASTAGAANNSLPIERSIIEKVEVIKRLFVRLLDANQIYYTHKDIPDFKYKDPDQITLDEAGKFLQRVRSVSGDTPDLVKFVYGLIDAPTAGIDEVLDFTERNMVSRAGEGQGSSGSGSGTQDNSSTNTENKSMEGVKKWVVDNHGDGTGALLDENQKLIRMVNIDD